MQREMGISPSHWGWVIGAFTLSYALFEIERRAAEQGGGRDAAIHSGLASALESRPRVALTGPFTTGFLPPGLNVADMQQGLESQAFRQMAIAIRDNWCGVSAAFHHATRTNQEQSQNRWTIHPLVDGCQPASGTPPHI
jgi:hypothetical protein